MVSPAINQAARTALGTCFGALLTLYQPLRSCFSDETQALLPTSATMAIFCGGRTLEESFWLSAEAFAGCVLAALNTVVLRNLFQVKLIPTDSWLGQFVLLEGAVFVAVVCLTPASESTKMYVSSLTAYFVMSLYSGTELSVLRQCLEYLAMSSFGSICVVIAYALPLPGLPNTRGLHMAEVAFDEVADECAEIITEATTALLNSGAGEAWRYVARERLAAVSDKLAEARFAVEYVEWSPSAVLRRLTRRSAATARARREDREAAFRAAAEAIDTCRLLCELAISAHTRSDGVGVAVVRSAAAACLLRVSANAASLLRDLSRTSFRRVTLDESLGDSAATLGDERRQRLRNATRSALRNSSVAGRELLWVGLYAEGEDNGLPKRDLATARADLAAFLFLVHGLAVDLLHAESTALRAARRAAVESGMRDEGGRPFSRIGSSNASDLEDVINEEDEEVSGDDMSNLRTPLLQLPPRKRINSTTSSNHMMQVPCASAASAPFDWKKMAAGIRSGVRSAVLQRWRIALKVFLQFYPSFWMSVYLFNKDGTLVTAVSMLCSYGSQYDGGSLRRSMSRIVGVAGGASFGSALEQLFASVFSDAAWLVDGGFGDAFHRGGYAFAAMLVYQGGALITSLFLLWSATFAGVLLCFRGGPHSYAGFCAGFTAAKFLLCSRSGCLQVSTSITYNMYAASLAVAVEMGVLPIHAIDLLRVRLAGALLGAAAVLSSLVTSEASVSPIAASFASDTLKQTRKFASEHRAASDVKPILRSLQTRNALSCQSLAKAEAEQLAQGKLPDLSERLRLAGILDKYIAWRDSYFQWRSNRTKGPKGELVEIADVEASPPAEHGPEASPSECLPADGDREARPRRVSSNASITSCLTADAFAPPAVAISECATLEPFAGVPLPTLETEGVVDGSEQDHSALANNIILGADTAFLQGTAQATAPDETLPQTPYGKCALDFGAAFYMPQLQELLRQRKEEPEENRGAVDSATGRSEHVDGARRWKKTRLLIRAAQVLTPHHAAGGGGEQAPSHAAADSTLPPATVAPGPAQGTGGSSAMSLAQVHVLLDEIDSALAPAADLAAQAGERLDAQRVDIHMWQRLATAIAVVRLRLSMLARIALRLQRGVRVPDLMGGEQEAGEALVEAFGAALAAATAAVAGGAPTPPGLCAELEAKLRLSSEALTDSLAMRRAPEASSLHAASSAEVISEVLAGTAAHTLVALLGDARELLVLACALSGGGGGAPIALGSVAKVAPDSPEDACVAGGNGASALALPDLTERMKRAGTYEKYVAFSDGYRQWRMGGGNGAKAEVMTVMIDKTNTTKSA